MQFYENVEESWLENEEKIVMQFYDNVEESWLENEEKIVMYHMVMNCVHSSESEITKTYWETAQFQCGVHLCSESPTRGKYEAGLIKERCSLLDQENQNERFNRTILNMLSTSIVI